MKQFRPMHALAGLVLLLGLSGCVGIGVAGVAAVGTAFVIDEQRKSSQSVAQRPEATDPAPITTAAPPAATESDIPPTAPAAPVEPVQIAPVR
ncbi:MAG TPA: hypothetical protein VLL72_06765 [Kiloniellales bacterium]|nr:hypothetical protein [Kiloniellales bacterium]